MDAHTWYQFDGVAAVAACVVVLFYSFPAYKRTKQAGFIFWCLSALGSLWNTLTLRTIGADPHGNPAGYIFIHQSYRVLYIVDATLSVIGTVLVINSYLQLFESKQQDANDASSDAT